jgi:hypothetical protein
VATPTPAGLAAGAADGRRCRAAAGAESGGGAAGPGPRALEAGDSVAAAAPAPDAGAAGARATRRPEIRRAETAGDIVLKAGGRRAGTNHSYSRVLQSTCTRYEQ